MVEMYYDTMRDYRDTGSRKYPSVTRLAKALVNHLYDSREILTKMNDSHQYDKDIVQLVDLIAHNKAMHLTILQFIKDLGDYMKQEKSDEKE